MPKCERCKTNEARVRLDAINNGKREQHYLCRSCAEELMGGQLGASAGGPDGLLGDLGAMNNPFRGWSAGNSSKELIVLPTAGS